MLIEETQTVIEDSVDLTAKNQVDSPLVKAIAEVAEPKRDPPGFYSYEDYLKLPKNPSKWIINGFLPLGFSVVYAKPKTGKSTILLSMAEAICNGATEWEGFPIDLYGNVLYLQVDTPRETWADNMARMRMKPDRPYEFYCADAWTTSTYPFNILQGKKDSTLFDRDGNPIPDPLWLEKEIEKYNPILIIVDTIREIHNEDEDKSGAMKIVINTIQKAAGRGKGIILVSHSKKDSAFTTNSEDDIMDQGRGSTYVAGKMDMIVRMTKKEIHWKGRSIGYKKLPYKWDERFFPKIERTDEEKKDQSNDIIAMLCDNNPGISKTALAEKLAALTKQSVRTSYRRIDEWNKQNDARSKAIHRMNSAQSLLAVDPAALSGVPEMKIM